MSINTPVQQPIKEPRPEMWLITLAKSKTMRFFAVSCEFIIFLGCLWLTLVTILPGATSWLWGGVDNFFLVAMGFAVDAALPESFLHVVDQYIEKKHTQLKWSIPIAIAMLLLVFANFVYTKLTNGAHPTGTTEALVNILLISRMGIGICYVTIRECQSFIDRKQYNQAPPALPAVDVAEMVNNAVDMLASKVQNDQARLFADLQQQLAGVQSQIPTIDTQAIAGVVLTSLESRFTSEMKMFQADLRQHVSVTLANEMAEVVTNERYKNSTILAPASSVTGQVNHSSAITHKLPAITEKHAAVTPGNVRQFPQKSAPVEDTGAAVIRVYLEDTSRSQRAIAALVGTSEATVNRRLKEYLGTAQAPTTSTDVTA